MCFQFYPSLHSLSPPFSPCLSLFYPVVSRRWQSILATATPVVPVDFTIVTSDLRWWISLLVYQFSQKLKLLGGGPIIVLYFNTPPYVQARQWANV